MPSRSPNGILFAEDFDDEFSDSDVSEAIASAPEPETADPVEPFFTADDLAAARSESYAEGYQAAADEAAARENSNIARCLAQIEHHLEDAHTHAVASAAQASEAVARLIFGTLASILPTLCARHEAAEIAGLVATTMVGMAGVPAVCVTVAPPLVDPLRECLVDLPPDTGRRVAIAAQDGMETGDARIAWEAGAAGRSSRRAREAVIAVLTQLGLVDPPAQPPSPQRPWTQASPLSPPASTDMSDLIAKVETADA